MLRAFFLPCFLLAGYALAEDIQHPALDKGQSVLTNDSILKMVGAKLGDDVIVSIIKAQPGRYQTGLDDVVTLKGVGVTEKVIAAMVDKMAAENADRIGIALPIDNGGSRPVQEVGVYYMKGSTWTDLSPEIVNFKTGGVLKHVTTVGIVKSDINGHLNKKHSGTSLKCPVHLQVFTLEGVAITEYQLLNLHVQGGSREFRTVTGGRFHVSGGATRDLLPFESYKIGPRTFEILLSDLKAGEYGLLPPTALDATASSGRIGKLYTFTVLE